ncbi:MAG: OadG family protein [Planctomycetales bacterium]|nr:OadG family protein [Planctomycetales bacterium]
MAAYPSISLSMLAQISLAPLWEDYGVPLAIMGMLVVFLVLALVVTFITVLPRLIALLDHWPSHAARQAAAPKTAGADANELPEEIVAVIAAAAAVVVDQPHRVVHIREAAQDEHGWAQAGRMQLHTSHQIKRGEPR